MNISKKIKLSMIGLTCLVLVATLGLARWSFEQGFTEFMNGLEQERLTQLSVQVAQYYESNQQSWRNIENSLVLNQSGLSSEGRNQGRKGLGRRPPPPRHTNSLPPRESQNRPPPRVNKRAPPTSLLTLDGRVLLSDVIDQAHEEGARTIDRVVEYQGQDIAVLRSYLLHPLQTGLASQFAQQQMIASLVIGAVSLILAAILSFAIASQLVKPITLISRSVSQLTKGKYTLAFKANGKDEISQLMQDLQSLSETLDKSRTQKSRWFADISHELRTPLTILIGEIEAMHAGIRKFDQQQLDSIEQEVLLLNRLVDDLYQLSLSDVGALKYEFGKVNISELLLSITHNFNIKCDDAHIELKQDIMPNIVMSADRQRFEQLVINLLNNSLKYTDPEGTIKLSLFSEYKCIFLTVDDSHPSVPEEECEQLFETLYQRNASRNRANSGAGLGLAICKNIATSHHASISAQPSPLGGLRITIRFNQEGYTHVS